ncbi:hypothetical protein [Streptomyces sp. cmx-4-9]|uniref:hypothetical protein n=1 Tax=Streptomyces sp. cmx-4-9 TaxID=2790941 RepID=UPI00397FECA6
MTQRLDPGSGWYGEFLRRDPEGVRACLQGAAMAPWDVVESLLRDLAALRGEEFAAREAAYATGLRAAAVAAWDRLPGGAAEVQALLLAAQARRAEADAALRSLSARLAGAAGREESEALDREIAWTRDDAARATSRHADLAARLAAVSRPAPVPEPSAPEAGPPPKAAVGRAEGRWLRGGHRSGGARYAGAPAPAPAPGAGPGAALPPGYAPQPAAPEAGPGPAAPPPRGARFGAAGRPGAARGAVAPAQAAARAAAGDPAPAANAVGEAASVGAAGDPEADADAGVEGGADAGAGARAAAGPGGEAEPAGSGGAPAPAAPARRPVTDFVADLLTLRARGRTGEAHVLLCEAAAWPAGRLPGLAAELTRAGLAADWATLLWEAASLPPERLAAAAAALGGSGRDADCDALLRQGAARPTAEIAEAALALGAAGRSREAEALLGAFVRVRTPQEAARLARRDPQWFAPRLLRAARALSGSRHRDLLHALRVAGISTA